MRIGILGGTFDPIHFGHLRAAEEIGEDMELKKVFLIPGALPPHKDRKMVTPFSDRLAMTRLAIGDSPMLEMLDLEGRREGVSYSIETLREIHKLYSEDLELFFIIGFDAFMEIKTWKEYRSLFSEAHFVVIKRPGLQLEDLDTFVFSLKVGFEKGETDNTFVIPSGNSLFYRKTTLLDISSTRIREMSAHGKSIRFLVPDAVNVFIAEKGLYSRNGNN